MTITRGRFLKGSLATIAALAAGAGVASVAGAQTPPMRRGPGMMGQGSGVGPGAGPGAVGVSDTLLQRLGLTAEQLAAERRAGKSLAQIAETKGVDRATLVSLLTEEHKAMLAEHVKAGRLTQAQADEHLAQMQERIETAVDRTDTGAPPWAGAGNGAFGLGMGPGPARARSRMTRPGAGPAAAPGATPDRAGSFSPPWARQAQP